METLKGYISHITYHNSENGYSVFTIASEGDDTTCIGKFASLSEGEIYELTGFFTEHKTYGIQFSVVNAVSCQPEDAVSMERYLSSGVIKGIKSTLATRIVKRFGDDTFRIMEEEPERLAEVKGISMRMARDIALQIEDKKEQRDAVIFLQKYGISLNLAMKIYKYYGERIYGIMRENPYRLAEDLEGVGFKTADEIAIRGGIQRDSDYRIKSALLYALQSAITEGHIFLYENELKASLERLLLVELGEITNYVSDLSIDGKIVIKKSEKGLRIYPLNYFHMENKTAAMLLSLNITRDISEESVRNALNSSGIKCRTFEDGDISGDNEILYLDALQEKAVIEAARRGILIMTGGPGTGKTTAISAMLKYYQSIGANIALAAPTGRAAKRMTEATGYEACTLHRLLEVVGNPEEGGKAFFQRNEDNQLEQNVIIIDEASMVDLPLMNALLRATRRGSHLIFSGDRYQLPSVGPGTVLKDMITSGALPVVELTKIFRQAKESDIVQNAHRIHNGEQPVIDNQSKDFFFLKRDNSKDLVTTMLTLLTKKLPGYVGAKTHDLQVITPTRMGKLGVSALNRTLQAYLNPPHHSKKEKEVGDQVFREGDKVMQLKNNYQLQWVATSPYGIVIDKGEGVFNGDIGIITEINTELDIVEVLFDDIKSVSYSATDLDELELAYALTVHKSQGSEYPAVLLPILDVPRQLVYRNLLYTAITRARKCVVILGSNSDLRKMVDNNREQERNTSLSERISEYAAG